MVLQAFNPRTRKTEAGTSLRLKRDVCGSFVYVLLSLVNKETALAFDKTPA